jgi:hypothetical protein
MLNAIEMKVFHLLLAAIARQHAVPIIFGPYQTAFTDGKAVYVPNLPVNVPALLATLLFGILLHEGGHLRHTDFSLSDVLKSEDDPLLGGLYNCLEDVRIERAQIRLFPGAHRILSALMDALVQMGFFKPPASDASPAALTLGLVLMYLRWNVLAQNVFRDMVEQYRRALEDVLGVGFVTRLLALGQQITVAESSQDALDLAYRIRAFLRAEQEAQAPPPPPCESQQPSSSTGDASAELSTSAADPADGVPDDAPADDAAAPHGQDTTADAAGSPDPGDRGVDDAHIDAATSDATPDTPVSSAATGSDVPDPVAAKAFLDEMLSSAADTGDATRDLGEALSELVQVELQEHADAALALPDAVTTPGATTDAAAVLAAQQVSQRLAAQLKRQLDAQDRVLVDSRKSGRRTDRRHLARVKFGDSRVFEKRVIEEAVNTSVACIIDSSGSMAGTGTNGRPLIHTAREALLATMLALHSIRGVEACAGAFPYLGNRVLTLADFDENPMHVSSRFALGAGGGTPMAEALLWACHRLSTRDPDRRKLVLIATDGEPDRPVPMAQLVRNAEAAGIEVYGLGIGCDDTHQLFSRFSRVDDVSNLSTTFLELFRSALARRRA